MLAHDPVGVAHQLGHGELAGKVGTGLELLDDRGELDDLAVQLDLGRGQLGDVPGPGVLAEERVSRPRLRNCGSSAGSASQPASAALPSAVIR